MIAMAAIGYMLHWQLVTEHMQATARAAIKLLCKQIDEQTPAANAAAVEVGGMQSLTCSRSS
jgi:hypothetical protein